MVEHYPTGMEKMFCAGKIGRYRIFHVEKEKDGGIRKVEMSRFWAKDDDEAFRRLKDYRKIANKEFTYYYEPVGHAVRKCEKDGELRHYDDFLELAKENNRSSDLKTRIRRRIGSLVRRWTDFTAAFGDISFWLRNYSLRTNASHMPSESWDLHAHMLDDLAFNIPRILENSYSFPQLYVDRALERLHRDDKSFSVEKFYDRLHGMDCEKDEAKRKQLEDEESKAFDLAVEDFRNDLKELLTNVRLYRYIEDDGHVDPSDKDAVEFDRKYRSRLPIRPGTYDRIDYERKDALKRKYSAKIWNFVRDRGYVLAD